MQSFVKLIVLSSISAFMCFEPVGFCTGQESIPGIEFPASKRFPRKKRRGSGVLRLGYWRCVLHGWRWLDRGNVE